MKKSYTASFYTLFYEKNLVIWKYQCMQVMKVKWYRKLYMGKTAKKKRYEIVWKVKHNAGMLHAHVITLASNENNLLDIIPCRMLLQEGYPKKNMFIVGIAADYEEALEVVQNIIMEVYHATGGFQIRKFIMEQQEAE